MVKRGGGHNKEKIEVGTVEEEKIEEGNKQKEAKSKKVEEKEEELVAELWRIVKHKSNEFLGY